MNEKNASEGESFIGSLSCLRLELTMPDGTTKTAVGRFIKHLHWYDPVPKEYHRYAIRHSDGDDSVPATLEEMIIVNRFGDFLCRENLTEAIRSNEGYLTVSEWEFYI